MLGFTFRFTFRLSGTWIIPLFEAFRGRTQFLDRDELEFLCLELIVGEIPSSGTSAWLSDCTPNSMIEILWHTGFLCAESAQDDRASKTGSVSFSVRIRCATST
jgi:hypothetical protein